jgi:predicted nucleic-acid-binding Zn-ribbon protein
MSRPASKQGDECPKCGNNSLRLNTIGENNVCTSCHYTEAVEQPKSMTKWDIIDLVKNDKDVRKAILGIADDAAKEAARDSAWS